MASAPYFDETQGGWVLTRYADVTAALRDPRLWPMAAKGEDLSKTRDEVGRLRVRGDVNEWLAGTDLHLEESARAAVEDLPDDRVVDLLAEFFQPWCLGLAIQVTRAAEADRERLSRLSQTVFAGTGAAEGSDLRSQAAAATAQLEVEFQAVPMGEPTFIAISQTTARLLSNAWLALFEHPQEYARLRSDPDLAPGAMEELLRYAGIVRRIFRSANEDLELGGVRIAKGDRVLLLLAEANRDPEQFPEPDRLDVTRKIAAQVALGLGRNSCVGGPFIRMAGTAATRSLVERFESGEVAAPIEWRVGSGFRFPAAVPVRLRQCQ